MTTSDEFDSTDLNGRTHPESVVVYVPGRWNAHLHRQKEIVEDHLPRVNVEPGLPPSILLGRHDKRVVVNVQWLDSRLRERARTRALSRVVTLLATLAVLRLRRVWTVWTCHNAVGKAHQRHRADRLLRSATVMMANRVIVHTASSAAVLEREVLAPVRRSVRRKTSLVPLPMLGEQHGEPISQDEARSELGIHSDRPLLAYLPGANQARDVVRFSDSRARYDLLAIDPEGLGGAPLRMEGGWVYQGRPSDHDYGLLLSACDAVLLTDQQALGSMTLIAAVRFRRPVISPMCPAVEELVDLGGAVPICGELTSDSIARAANFLPNLRNCEAAFADFERSHDDHRVAVALGESYAIASS